MKIVSLVVALSAVFLVKAQNSYYFADPLPSANMKVDHVSASFYGTYSGDDGTISYQFDETGLKLISTTIAAISRETVRESSKYNVRNGFIFGVEAGDSLPCVLKEDKYYFGVRNQDVYIGSTSENVLTKTSDPSVYVLNVYEDGKYVPRILRFKGNKLTISYFDYNGESEDEFAYISSQEVVQMDNLKLVILNPELTDFDRIQSQAFAESEVLKR